MQAPGKINDNDAEEGTHEEKYDKRSSHQSEWQAVRQRLSHMHLLNTLVLQSRKPKSRGTMTQAAGS